MEKIKILLLGLGNINNAGDEILIETTEWLVKKSGGVKIIRKQLMPAYKEIIKDYKTCILALPLKYLSRAFHGNIKYRMTNIMYKIKYKRYFRDCIKKADKIVLPVGMLKYTTQDLSYLFEMINGLATRYNKPVLMSAMSIAKPDKHDWRYNQLVKAVNLPCVKSITTRDGKEGLTRLRKYYTKENIHTDYVGDPALWIPECYQTERSVVRQSNIIGINVIRKGIHSAYSDKPFSDSQMINLYKEIITELERRGHQWILFCNGMQEDYEVALQLIDELGLPSEKLLPAPNSGKELVEMISSFKAVFGARLHACITAVSLGVPVSGLLWDDKLECFSRTMKIRQFFSDVEELKGNLVVDKLEAAINHEFDFWNLDSYKTRTSGSIKDFIS